MKPLTPVPPVMKSDPPPPSMTLLPPCATMASDFPPPFRNMLSLCPTMFTLSVLFQIYWNCR